MKYKTLTLLGTLALSQLTISCNKKEADGANSEENVPAQGEQKQSMSESGDETSLSEGEDSFEAVSDDIVKMVETMTQTLSMAKDAESANSAMTKLDALANEANGYAERLKALGKPNEEQVKLVNDKMQKVESEMNQEMMATMTTIMQNPEVAEIIQKGLLEFAEKTAAMDEISKEYFGNTE